MSLLGKITSFIKTDIMGIEETNNTQKSSTTHSQKEAVIQCTTDRPEDTFKESGKTSRKGQGKGLSLKAAEEAIANTPSEKFNIRKMLKDGLLEKVFGDKASKEEFNKLTPEQKQLVIMTIKYSIAKFEKMMKNGELSPDANPEQLVSEFCKILYDAINSGSYKSAEEFENATDKTSKLIGKDYDKLPAEQQKIKAKACRAKLEENMQAELDSIKNLPIEERTVAEAKIIRKYKHLKRGTYFNIVARNSSMAGLSAMRMLDSKDAPLGINMLLSTRSSAEERTKTADMADYNYTKELIKDYKEFGDKIEPESLRAYTSSTMSYKSSDAVSKYQTNYKADRDKYEAALIKQKNGEPLTEEERSLLETMDSEYYTATAQGIGEGALNNVNMTTEEKSSFLNQWDKDAQKYNDYKTVTANVKQELEKNPEHREIKNKIEEIKQQEKEVIKTTHKKEERTQEPELTQTNFAILPISKPETKAKTAELQNNITKQYAKETNIQTANTSDPIVIAQIIKDYGIEKALEKDKCGAIQMILDNSSFKHLRPKLTTIIRAADLKTLTEMTSSCSDSAFVYVCSVVSNHLIIPLKENRVRTKGLCYAATTQVENIEGEHEII